MKINFILSILIVFIVFCTSVSCNNSSSINKKEIIGKWNIVGLISKTDKITITESNLYTVEFNSNDTFIMQGEDNQLKAKFAFNNPNELQLEEIMKTDVCCNSPLADSLFNAFTESKYLYNFREDTLQITTINKSVLLVAP